MLYFLNALIIVWMHKLVITFTSKIPFLLLHVKGQDLNFDFIFGKDQAIL